jgi:hypothetical protein
VIVAAPRRALSAALFAMLVFAASAGATAPSTVRAATPPAAGRSSPALSNSQAGYLSLAEQGVAAARARWWDPRHGWYDESLADTAQYPLATIWDAAPLFESLDAIAIASPTAAHLAAVASFAAGAERYLNHGLRPVDGYSPYQGDRSADTETWFDDNGWWGLGFVNAYLATSNKR